MHGANGAVSKTRAGITISPRALLRYLALPARPSGMLLIGVLTIGFGLALRAGFVGIPLGLMMLFWLLAYSYVLLEHVAHGTREPPVLSIEMVNPVAAARPLTQLAMVLLAAALLRSLALPLGPILLHLLELLLLLALPASIAASGIARHWWQALAPTTLWACAVSTRTRRAIASPKRFQTPHGTRVIPYDDVERPALVPARMDCQRGGGRLDAGVPVITAFG